jgi:hypothetical protein
MQTFQQSRVQSQGPPPTQCNLRGRQMKQCWIKYFRKKNIGDASLTHWIYDTLMVAGSSCPPVSKVWHSDVTGTFQWTTRKRHISVKVCYMINFCPTIMMVINIKYIFCMPLGWVLASNGWELTLRVFKNHTHLILRSQVLKDIMGTPLFGQSLLKPNF